MPPETCPNCSANVPRNATGCPECGADESNGWSEQAYSDNLGLLDENFDHEQFVKEEFDPGVAKPRGIHWLWWLTALILVALFLIFCLH